MEFLIFSPNSELGIRETVVTQINVLGVKVAGVSFKPESIPDPGIPKWPFVKFAHRRFLTSSRRALFIFSRAVFRAAPWLTERLEDAIKIVI